MNKPLCRFLPARWLRFGLLVLALLSAVSVSGDEAKLGTVISSFPCTLTESKVYILQADYPNLNLAGDAAITVACDNITIDLNGHTLGNAAAGADNYATGVLVQGRSNVTVRNGVIKGFLTGVYLSQAANPSQSCLVEEMNLSGNLTSGVCVEGTNNIVRGCQIERTGGSTLPGYELAAAVSVSGYADRVLDCDIGDVGANGVGILFSLGADHFAVNNRLSGPAAFGLWYDYSASGKYAKNLVSGDVGQAYVGGTDAGQNMVDGNNNGVDDDWEIKHFGDLSHTNPAEDSDGDGSSNLQEYQLGTDPNDRMSYSVSRSLVPGNASGFVRQNVPQAMMAGQTYEVSIAMQNMGTNAWQPGAQLYKHRLGSQNPENNSTWNSGRVDATETIAPWFQHTYTFTVTAPSAPGMYNFQWRMVQEAVQWFGDQTPNVAVAVITSTSDINNNGIPDAWEAQYFGDLSHAANEDTDGDGLTNLQEYQLGSNPAAYSTAGDGVSDGWKAAQPAASGINVHSVVSTAMDGIPDAWKTHYNLLNNHSLQDNIANLDDDGDGLTNLQEYQLGTSPISSNTDGDEFNDADDPNPTILNPKAPTSVSVSDDIPLDTAPEDADYTKVKLRWQVPSQSGATGFLIERKVSTGEWKPLTATVTSEGNNVYTAKDSDLVANQNFYYRVSSLNQTANGTAYSQPCEPAAHQIPFVLGFDVKESGRSWDNPAARQFTFTPTPEQTRPKFYKRREHKVTGATVSGKYDVTDDHETTGTLDEYELSEYNRQTRGWHYLYRHKLFYGSQEDGYWGLGTGKETTSKPRRPGQKDKSFTYSMNDYEYKANNGTYSWLAYRQDAGVSHQLLTAQNVKWTDTGYGVWPPETIDYSGSQITQTEVYTGTFHEFAQSYGTLFISQSGMGLFAPNATVAHAPDWTGDFTDNNGSTPRSYPAGPPSPIDDDGHLFAPHDPDIGPPAGELVGDMGKFFATYRQQSYLIDPTNQNPQYFYLTDTIDEASEYAPDEFFTDSTGDLVYPEDFTPVLGGDTIYEDQYKTTGLFDGALDPLLYQDPENVHKWTWVADNYLVDDPGNGKQTLYVHRIKYKVRTSPSAPCVLRWYDVFVPRGYTKDTTDPSKLPKVIASHSMTLPLPAGADGQDGGDDDTREECEVDPVARASMDGEGDYYVMFSPTFIASVDDVNLDPTERKDEGITLQATQVTPPPTGGTQPPARTMYTGPFEVRLTGVPHAIYTFTWDDDPGVTLFASVRDSADAPYHDVILHSGDTLTEEQLRSAGGMLTLRMDPLLMTSLSAVITVSATDAFGVPLSGYGGAQYKTATTNDPTPTPASGESHLRAGVPLQLEFTELTPNSGFDGETKPNWLMVPLGGSNWTKAYWVGPTYPIISALLDVDIHFKIVPEPSNATVTPDHTHQSPEPLKVSGSTRGDFSRLVGGSNSSFNTTGLNLSVKEIKNVTVAIHAVTQRYTRDHYMPLDPFDGIPNFVCLTPKNSTTPGTIQVGGDDQIRFDGSVTTGENGVCETSANSQYDQVIDVGWGVHKDIPPQYVPSAQELQVYLNTVFGPQTNTWFTVTRSDKAVDYDIRKDKKVYITNDPILTYNNSLQIAWSFQDFFEECKVLNEQVKDPTQLNIYFVHKYNEDEDSAGRSHNNIAYIQDDSANMDNVMWVASHEVGHMLPTLLPKQIMLLHAELSIIKGYRNPTYLVNGDPKKRLMYGRTLIENITPRPKSLIKSEWDLINPKQ